jgi:spore coat polysaccharide biosynthesis protein SpsF
MKQKLVCVLACRNQGSRLYGKPLQNLDFKKKIRVIDFLINRIKKIGLIDDIVLAISDTIDNKEYIEVSKSHSVKYVIGDERDVLKRLILGGNKSNATDVFRVTSESPFIFNDKKIIYDAWKYHRENDLDFSYLDKNFIDGCGFEIISMRALKSSHKFGKKRHRSELCSLYIRENLNKYKSSKIEAPKFLIRKDIRLTIDYPEDLIICRKVYERCKNYQLRKIVTFIDKNQYLKKMCKKIIYDEKKI